MKVAKEAALMAKQEGISVELIDLQTLYPYDADTLVESVLKTGRCVITHEAPITSGLGSELASTLSDRCFERLQAPIRRVCGYDTPFPMTLEPLYLPDKFKVFHQIKDLTTQF